MSAPIAVIGRSAARRLTRTGGLARFTFEAFRAIFSLPGAGRPVAGRLLLNQLRFTAVEAVGLIALLSGIFSFLVISMAVRELGRVGAYDLIGRLIVIIIVRQLRPTPKRESIWKKDILAWMKRKPAAPLVPIDKR